MVNNNQAAVPAIDNSVFFRKAGFFKFYLFSVVILTHALNYEAYSLGTQPGAAAAVLYFLERLEFNVSWISMPLYFLISGYSFMLGFKISGVFSKWKRRVYSLLIPWLLWNSIMWLLGIAMETIPAIASRLNSGFGYELSLRSWVVDGLLLPADGPLWFLTNLMVAVLLSPVIHLLTKNRYVGLAAIAACFAAIHFTNASRFSILMSLLFFTEASFCAAHLQHLVVRQYRPLERMISGLILAGFVLFSFDPRVLGGGLIHALTFSVASPALWVVVGNVRLGEKAAKAEKYRFWVYASHYLPLECVEKLWLIVGGVSVGAAWLGMIMCPVVTLVLLVAAGMLAEKFCYPLWCMLTGKKPRLRPKE